MNRRERIADYINQRMEGFSKVPNVLADRALKNRRSVFSCSFFLEVIWEGRWIQQVLLHGQSLCGCLESDMRSICYGVGRKRNMRQSEGTVYEIKGKRIPGRVCKVGNPSF